MDENLKPLLADIAGYCKRHGMSKSSFGRKALADPNFVSDIEDEGRSPTMSTVRKVRKFMEGK